MTNYEAQKNITMFLLNSTGSIFGKWEGKMKANQQRELFGHFLGKGTITIDGSNDTITHSVKVDFGNDSTETGLYKLVTGELWIKEVKQTNQKEGVLG